MTRARQPQWGLDRLIATLHRHAARPAVASRVGLVGRDLAPNHLNARPRGRMFPVVVIGALLAALGLAALRVDGIRQRYALADALRAEQALLEEHDRLTAQVRRLRDPARLARLASRMNLVRPEHIIELEAPNAASEPRP